MAEQIVKPDLKFINEVIGAGGATPGEVWGAVIKISLQEYSAPGFLAKMVGDPKFLIPLLAVPAIIYIAIIAMQGFLSGTPIPTEDGHIVYGKFLFSLKYVDPIFTAAARVG